MNRARRSHEWRELEAQLECVGVALQTPSLVLEPQPPEELRYPVPVGLELLVESDGIEWLAWTWQGPVGTTPPLSPARRACLPAFMRLGDAPLRKVLAFARAWGPLGEGWRRAMPGSFPPYPESRERLVRRPINVDAFYAWEPVEAWRRLARQLAAMLRLAARLQRGETCPWRGPGSEDWEAIMAADPQGVLYMAWLRELRARRPVAVVGPEPSAEDLVKLSREQVARVVDVWLAHGGVQLVPCWREDMPHLAVRVDFDRSAGLHGLLGLEIATALASPFGVVQCAGCGYPYAPQKRRPRADRRPYCPACSEGASLAAKRAWWRRNRSVAAPS